MLDSADSVRRMAESMRVFADGEETFKFGEWRQWRRDCLKEGRTIPPAEFKARLIACEIRDTLYRNGLLDDPMCVQMIQRILDRHLKGKAVVPQRPQMREGDLFVLMETLHKGRMYCIGNYVASHRLAKNHEKFIAMTAQEMFHSLYSSLIAKAEKS